MMTKKRHAETVALLRKSTRRLLVFLGVDDYPASIAVRELSMLSSLAFRLIEDSMDHDVRRQFERWRKQKGTP